MTICGNVARCIGLSIGLCLFLVPDEYSAQTDSTIGITKPYLKSYFKDPVSIVVAPFKAEKRQLITAGISLVALTMTYALDEPVQEFSQANRTNALDAVAKYGLEPWGSGMYTGGLMAAFWLGGQVFKTPKLKRAGLLGLKAIAVTAPFIALGKALSYRDRPYYQDGPNHTQWHTVFGAIDQCGDLRNFNFSTSFPSGHTTSAFAVATMVAIEYNEKPWVAALSYSLATLTGLSRIYENKHWTTDVVAGAIFGTAMARVIYRRNNARFSLVPINRGVGLGMTMPLGTNN